MLGLGLGFTSRAIVGGGSGGDDADALALFAAWAAAGVPASDADKARATALIAALKSAGLWSNLTVLQVYGVHADLAARVNWKSPGTYDATLAGAPTFTAYQGYATDGVDDAVLVFNPFGVLAQDNFHAGAWLIDTAQSTPYHFGWYDGSDGILFNARNTSNQIGAFASVAAADQGIVGGITTAAGLTVLNRSASNAVQCYRDGVAQTMTNATAASVAINNHALQIGSTSTFMAAHGLFAVAGASLSAGQHASLYSALNTFKTSLSTWTPTDLGVKLKAWWSADDHGTARMTDDGAGLISSWADKVGAMAATGTTTARPTWAATSFNSAYAGLTFDGTANCLAATTLTTLPTGAVAGEVWSIASQTLAAGVTPAVRMLVRYGGTTAATARGLNRTFVAAASMFHVTDGQTTGGYSDTLVDLLGPHILGQMLAGTTLESRIDGRATSPASSVIVTLATGTVRLRIGSSNATTAANFWGGVVRHVFVTLTLSATEREKLEGWMAWDSGLASLLPGGHPYKLVPP